MNDLTIGLQSLEIVFLPCLLVAALGGLYLMPWCISAWRGHRNSTPIFVLNLVFGWTLIGWVGCLAWSLASGRDRA